MRPFKKVRSIGGLAYLCCLRQRPSEEVQLGVLRVEELRRQRMIRRRMPVLEVNGADRDLGRRVRVEIELCRGTKW